MDLKLHVKSALISGSTAGIGFAIALGWERCDFVRLDFNSQLQSYILNKKSYLAAMPAAGCAYAALNR